MAAFGLVLLSQLVAPAALAAPAPGDLDRSYGSRGTTEIQQVLFPDGEHAMEVVEAVEVGPAGEALVASWAPVDCPFPADCPVDLAVSRYDADGNRDLLFGGGDGSFTVRLDPPPAGLLDAPFRSVLKVDRLGSIVLAANDGGDVRVMRLGPEGEPTDEFGGGEVSLDWGGEDGIGDLIAYADGSLLLAGDHSVGAVTETVLQRLLPGGEPDRGFGDAGLATARFGGVYEVGFAAGVGSRRIAVGAPSATGGQLSLFDASGALDLDFHHDGTARIGGGPDSIDAVFRMPQGKLLVVFTANHGPKQEWVSVARLRGNGQPDSDFRTVELGHNGSPVDSRADAGAALDGGGHLLIGEHAKAGKRFSGLRIRRLRLDGARDRTFAGGRVATVGLGEGYGRGLGLGLQPSGRILLAGAETSCSTVCYPIDPDQPPRSVIVAFAGGTSRATCQGRRATIVGTGGSDRLDGTQGRDVIAALGGDDVVRGLGGNDLICGHRGHDKLFGGAGRDRVRQ